MAHRRPKSGTNPATVIGVVGVVAILGVVAALNLGRDPPPNPAPAPSPADTPSPAPQDPTPPPAAAPVAGPATAADEPKPATPAPDAAPVPREAPKPEQKGNYGSFYSLPGDQLFVRVENVPGTTEEERTAMDRDATAFADRDSARAGTDAMVRLRKKGRKAIPSLLSVFASHWQGTKWESDAERFASFEIQKLLAEIVKADRPGGDLFARFEPGVVVPSADFEKAARMWTSWWLGQGRHIDKFKEFAE